MFLNTLSIYAAMTFMIRIIYRLSIMIVTHFSFLLSKITRYERDQEQREKDKERERESERKKGRNKISRISVDNSYH
jgi:flagellar biosynthesis component FlhA